MMSLFVSNAWDFKRFGTATIDWTDDSGAHTFSITTGKYSHPAAVTLNLYDQAVTSYATGITEFRAALQTGMDAATAQTITVARSAGLYLITCTTGATFAITFTGPAGLLMRQLLGFTGNRSGALSYMSQAYPRFQMMPVHQFRTAYTGLRHMPGAAKTHMTDAGRRRGFKPTTMPMGARWEHHFETDARVHRHKADADTVIEGHQSTWQAFYEDAGAASDLCFIEETGAGRDQFGFQLVDANLDESKLRRVRPGFSKWIVGLDVTPIGSLP